MHPNGLETPLLAGPDNVVSMRVLRPLLAAAERAGVPRDKLPHVSRALDERIALSEFYQLLETVLDLTDDPAFGLHCLERLTARAFNPVADLVYHSADLRQSLA